MSAHVIAEILVTDPAGYEEFRRLAGASVARYGGKYVVAGEVTDRLSGAFIVEGPGVTQGGNDWPSGQIVIIEFESAARAREWVASQEYREAKDRGTRTAIINMTLAEDD